MNEISYIVKKSDRAKRLSLKVENTGQVVVTLPKRLALKYVAPFVKSNLNWIHDRIAKIKTLDKITIANLGPNSYDKHILAAKKALTAKVKYWNQFYNFNYKNISIKNLSSRWGSCSRVGNLNFNYKLNLIDESLLDYVVVHELCHLKEMNHGPKFWILVEQTMPDYKSRRHKLKNINIQ